MAFKPVNEHCVGYANAMHTAIILALSNISLGTCT